VETREEGIAEGRQQPGRSHQEQNCGFVFFQVLMSMMIDYTHEKTTDKTSTANFQATNTSIVIVTRSHLDAATAKFDKKVFRLSYRCSFMFMSMLMLMLKNKKQELSVHLKHVKQSKDKKKGILSSVVEVLIAVINVHHVHLLLMVLIADSPMCKQKAKRLR